MQQLWRKITLHPKLQSLTTDISACRFKLGTSLPVFACTGNIGQSISHSCVDFMLFPSGITILIGVALFRTLL